MNNISSKSSLDETVIYSKGTVLMVEGEMPKYLILIKKGIVRTFRKDGHRLTAVGVVRRKGFVGALSTLTGKERSLTAIAVEDTEVYLIRKSDMDKVFADCPDWVSNIMTTISNRLEDSLDMLLEHKIIDDLNEQNLELSIEQEKEYIQAVNRYRGRRDL